MWAVAWGPRRFVGGKNEESMVRWWKGGWTFQGTSGLGCQAGSENHGTTKIIGKRFVKGERRN